MFLTNEQARARLGSEKNLANRFAKNPDGLDPDKLTEQVTQEVNETNSTIITERVISLPGKKGINLSSEVRTEIASRARLGESQPSLAQEFNITQANVSSIERGKTKGVDEARVEETINFVKDRALDRLMASLGLLTDDKLSGCSAKDLSLIASNMGRVVEKIQTKEHTPDNINFIIYAPELKQEKSYETVVI